MAKVLDVKIKLSDEIPVTPWGSGAGDRDFGDWPSHQTMAAELVPSYSPPKATLPDAGELVSYLFVTPYQSSVGLETCS